MGENLLQLDERLFVYLNNLHATWLDQVMYLMAQTYFWVPLHCLLIFLIIKQTKKESWIIIICIALAITAADRFTSGLMKPFFERPRPSHEPHLENVIHIVNNYKGGHFGFASSHAADTFALATFMWLLLRSYYKHIAWLFAWATLVTYTRIYLGVHYPGDLIVGAALGALFGYGSFKLSQYLRELYRRKMGQMTT